MGYILICYKIMNPNIHVYLLYTDLEHQTELIPWWLIKANRSYSHEPRWFSTCKAQHHVYSWYVKDLLYWYYLVIDNSLCISSHVYYPYGQTVLYNCAVTYTNWCFFACIILYVQMRVLLWVINCVCNDGDYKIIICQLPIHNWLCVYYRLKIVWLAFTYIFSDKINHQILLRY